MIKGEYKLQSEAETEIQELIKKALIRKKSRDSQTSEERSGDADDKQRSEPPNKIKKWGLNLVWTVLFIEI